MTTRQVSPSTFQRVTALRQQIDNGGQRRLRCLSQTGSSRCRPRQRISGRAASLRRRCGTSGDLGGGAALESLSPRFSPAPTSRTNGEAGGSGTPALGSISLRYHGVLVPHGRDRDRIVSPKPVEDRGGRRVGWAALLARVFFRGGQPMRSLWQSLEDPRRPDRSGLDRTQSGGSRAAGGAPAVDPATPPVRVGGLTGLVDRLRLRPGGLARPQRPSGSGLILTRGDRNQNGTPRTAEGPANDFKGGCRPLTALSALAEGPHRCHILPIFHPVRETIKGVKMQERL